MRGAGERKLVGNERLAAPLTRCSSFRAQICWWRMYRNRTAWSAASQPCDRHHLRSRLSSHFDTNPSCRHFGSPPLPGGPLKIEINRDAALNMRACNLRWPPRPDRSSRIGNSQQRAAAGFGWRHCPLMLTLIFASIGTAPRIGPGFILICKSRWF